MADLKTFFLGLANDRRLQIVELLATSGPMAGRDLAERMRLSQPLLSWHLRLLKRSGLVLSRRSGREIICSLDRRRYLEVTEAVTNMVMGTTRAAEPSLPTVLAVNAKQGK